MKLGIMQPYFFPYFAYWQLIDSVDLFLIYDDVNYIKGGWINRNQILLNKQKHYLNIRLYHASPNKIINEIELLNDPIYRHKTIRMIDSAYKGAPFFNQCMPLIEAVLLSKESNLAIFLFNEINLVCEYLHINTKIMFSSQIKKDVDLKAEDRIIHICKLLKADEYYNAIGGVGLYQKHVFCCNGIKLNFLKSRPIRYAQYGQNDFVGNLSIIDMMMNLSVNEIRELLKEYDLI